MYGGAKEQGGIVEKSAICAIDSEGFCVTIRREAALAQW